MNIPSGVETDDGPAADGLAAIRCVLPSYAEHLLALLADPGRIRLPAALAAAGELCAVVGRNITHVTHPPRSSADA
ncbi:hypothetical protein ABZ912_26830 [Nonomuraea angiospora]|uniref:hypothetical protein n=1 Tax=Nonomuraea angiospora TaxID=46172 RepID=UPI0033C606A4